jgi:hypothetical protein
VALKTGRRVIVEHVDPPSLQSPIEFRIRRGHGPLCGADRMDKAQLHPGEGHRSNHREVIAKALIIGGAGFLGANLVRRCLFEPEVEVTVMDSLDRICMRRQEISASVERISLHPGAT